MSHRVPCFVIMAALLVWPAWGAEEVSSNLLVNADFRGPTQKNDAPASWSLYAGGGRQQELQVVALDGGDSQALLLADGDAAGEIGLRQAIRAQEGLTYEASVEVRGVAEASSQGANIQLRFLPSNRLFQESLETSETEQFVRVAVRGTAPPGTTQAVVYLYSHREPTPKLLLRQPRLISGVAPPAPPYPDPVPPVYTKLKPLHLETMLVSEGKPNVTIVTGRAGLYGDQAVRIQQAIAAGTGVEVTMVGDDDPRADMPMQGNLILLGNRSSNRVIGKLYDLYYTLLDLKYPGPGGYVVRTLHNPFGGGWNVIFAGGSDAAGVEQAADVLVRKIREAKAATGNLALGRLMEIKMGQGLSVPVDIRQSETWEASKGYGSVGYFGWNSLSKRAAMYYMTGDEFHAREFYRLAFPDAQAKREIAEIDGERIENKDAPLSGPYHYNAHLMILFWDLIEESPIFTDEQRLQVTNAFSRQLEHRKDEGVYRRNASPRLVGSRHEQWSALSLYCLGRYFQKDYPHPIWAHCVRAGTMAFEPLHHHAWVSGESDNLFWYNTAIAPIVQYLVLTGDRAPVENGVISRLLRGQEILASGRQPDWALNSAALSFLHQAAYVMQDGRYLQYRERTGLDTDSLRLGQSFWPEDDLPPKRPEDLVGQWSIQPLPEPMWHARKNGFPLAESFLFGSFRSASDATGDFILLDGFNGASRNPYHTFAILELRLGGHTLLGGYRNQIATRMDGLVEPQIAMNARLRHHDVIGSTAWAVAEVPDMPYCHWRRALVQRVGQYALILDDLSFRAGSENMEVQIQWETEHTAKVLPDGQIDFTAPTEVPLRRTVQGGQIRTADQVATWKSGRVTTMQWVGPVRQGSHRYFFSLVGIQPDAKTNSLDCVRIGEREAALALPQPALAVAGTNSLVDAEFAVVADDHLFGKGLTRFARPNGHSSVAAAGTNWLAADQPVDVAWDFAAGELELVARQETRLDLAAGDSLRLNGQPVTRPPAGKGQVNLELPAGRHVITGAELKPESLPAHLANLLQQGRDRRATALAAAQAAQPAPLPKLAEAGAGQVGGAVTDLTVVGTGDGTLIYAAEGKRIHALQPDSLATVRTMEADGAVRMLQWWPEHQLLLAGSADEQVIAFDLRGQRKWVFTSEMDPAVFRAAKTYWFKSAPGHEGVHGLHTGVFLDGQSQAFVGSACTLELLDADGKLIKRMPQFWGKVSHFQIVDGPEGSLNLLASRKYNGTNTVAIINNRTLDPNPRGFHSVPPGSTYVPGWSSMNRAHLFYEDLDDDGKKEVISETNGTWNRVTVWSESGQPLFDASFGPGERIPAKNMRDLEVADLDGDGTKEIVVATSAGLLVALDHECRKLWARRLASPPVLMKCITTNASAEPPILVACEDGIVLTLDAGGQPVREGQLEGIPTCVAAAMDPSGGQRILLGTNRGEIKVFSVR